LNFESVRLTLQEVPQTRVFFIILGHATKYKIPSVSSLVNSKENKFQTIFHWR